MSKRNTGRTSVHKMNNEINDERKHRKRLYNLFVKLKHMSCNKCLIYDEKQYKCLHAAKKKITSTYETTLMHHFSRWNKVKYLN